MKVETLVVTINQNDFRLIEKMNIQTDAIIGNQSGVVGFEKFEYDGKEIKWYNFADRGVGLNRNSVLMRSSADICVFADDDMVFYDGYEKTVLKAFEDNKDADVIIFNIDETPTVRYRNTRVRKISKFNYGRYGAARIAFRRNSVFFSGISFNLLFGGGARFSCGEDTLFLKDCLRCGLKMVGVPLSIARLENDERESTWFNGYTDKFFYDKGVLNYCINKRLAKLITVYHFIRHGKTYKEYGVKKAYKMMLKGIKDAKKKRI